MSAHRHNKARQGDVTVHTNHIPAFIDAAIVHRYWLSSGRRERSELAIVPNEELFLTIRCHNPPADFSAGSYLEGVRFERARDIDCCEFAIPKQKAMEDAAAYHSAHSKNAVPAHNIA